ncbi:hypothetical protein GALMADRAFT_137737 [Galerina marginata CBS 339.88]|uniref:Uncharacterized protein n=1 Tax=Galerina marginata (strain CBS 339.88) TaxID=685588 RepID=A0A067T6F7_GALM3|nr:hypothetical protein GALMADRAFT_137737 [Galerina marginata CBS 339.88]
MNKQEVYHIPDADETGTLDLARCTSKKRTMRRAAKAKLVAIDRKLQYAKKKARSVLLNVLRAQKKDDCVVLPIQPPAPHLVQSNAAPTEAELSAVREAILAAEEEGKRLRSAIAEGVPGATVDITAFKKETQHKLDLITQFVVEQTAILSVVRRLPVELLQEIFIHTLTPQRGKRYYASPSCSLLPWSLSQVSQRWRNAALSTSALWRQLPKINFRGRPGITGNYDLEYITELLKRSHSMSIDIHIVGDFTPNFLHPTLDILIRHSDRWRDLTMDTANAAFAFGKIKGKLAALERLTLRHFTDDDLDDLGVGTTIDVFEIAPRLYDVHIEGPLRRFLLPSGQILHFSQDSGHLTQVPHVLPSNLALRTLELLELEGETLIPDTMLPNLVSLKIDFAWGARHELFLDSLTLPVLESLNIASYNGDLLLTVTSLIKRSGSPHVLKNLVLESDVMLSGQLTTLLSLTPALKNLNITFPPVDDLWALTSHQGDRVIVPLLERCHFSTESQSEITDETFQALRVLAESRCEANEPLPSAEITQASNDKPWQSLSVAFVTQPALFHRQLEGWVETDVSKKLETLGEALVKLLPQLSAYSGFPKRSFTLKWSWKDKVVSVLNEIKDIKVESFSDLVISAIYDKIDRLWNMSEKGHTNYVFSELAAQILENWDPVVEAGVKDARWLLSGWEIAYLSRNSDMRSTRSAADILFHPGRVEVLVEWQ